MSDPLTRFGLDKDRRKIFADLLSQLSGHPVVWKNEPMPQFGVTKQMITLRLRGVRTLGDGWEVITDNNNENTDTRIGAQRVADIECLVESFDPYIQAQETYLKMTNRLYRDRFREILHEANIAAINNSDAVDLPTTYDNRVITAAQGTIQLAMCDLDPETDQWDTWIETVDGSSTAIIPGSFTS